MDLATSDPAVTAQSTSVSLGRFPSESAENNLILDGSPGGARDKKRPAKPLAAFVRAQRENLLELRASLVNSMYGIVQETRSQAAGKGALSTHPADAGSDAYDRDFALSLLAEGGNALLQIDDALGRIDRGTYGICEMSGRSIPLPRLRAVPFARYTVGCQAEIEKRKKVSRPTRIFASPFAVANEEEGEEEGSDLGEVA